MRRQILRVVVVDRRHRGRLIGGVAEDERDRLAVLHVGDGVAGGVHLVLRDDRAGGVLLGRAVLHHRFLGDLEVDRGAVDELEALRPFGVLHAVGDRHHREHQERGDLDDVDQHVDAGRSRHAAEGDVGDAQREGHAEQDHEGQAVVAAAERVREKLVEQVAAEQRGHADHAARIDPVVEVARPAGDELGDARELVRVGLAEKGLLREEVRRAGAGIELGKLGVADRGREAEQERGDDAEPHRRACHGRAVERLHLVREPQERAGRDERHCVDREPGEA